MCKWAMVVSPRSLRGRTGWLVASPQPMQPSSTLHRGSSDTDTSCTEQRSFHKASERSIKLSLMFLRMTVAN